MGTLGSLALTIALSWIPSSPQVAPWVSRKLTESERTKSFLTQKRKLVGECRPPTLNNLVSLWILITHSLRRQGSQVMTKACGWGVCLVFSWEQHSLTAVADELNKVLTAWTSSINRRDFLIYVIGLVQKIKSGDAGKKHIFVLELKWTLLDIHIKQTR